MMQAPDHVCTSTTEAVPARHLIRGDRARSYIRREGQYMAKKKNSRKALAVVLGVVGVAGLSLASASQLTLNTGNEAAIGVATFSSCQTSEIDVDYTYNSSYVLQTLTLDSIDQLCEDSGAEITVTLEWNDGSAQSATFGPVAVDAGVHSVTISGQNIEVADDLGAVTVVID